MAAMEDVSSWSMTYEGEVKKSVKMSVALGEEQAT